MILTTIIVGVSLSAISIYLKRNEYEVTPTEAKYAIQDFVWSKILGRKKKQWQEPNRRAYLSLEPLKRFLSKLAPVQMLEHISKSLVWWTYVGFNEIRYRYYVLNWKVRSAIKQDPHFIYLFTVLFIQFSTLILSEYGKRKRKEKTKRGWRR